MSEKGATTDGYGRQLKRGALFNSVGLLGKLLHPVSIALATWLYGTETIASFMVALAVTEIVGGVALTGYTDATLLWAARCVDKIKPGGDGGRESYAVLANGFVFTVLVTLGLTALCALVAPSAIEEWLPQYSEIRFGLPILFASLIPRAVADISIAGTKAFMKMEYDALLKGFLHPVANIIFIGLFWWAGIRGVGLFLAFLAGECTVAALAIVVTQRFFRVGLLAKEIANFRFNREMFQFAMPQGLSTTLYSYQTQVDVLMLAGMGASELAVAWYATVSRLTRELRAIRALFSGALAPIFSRLHVEKNTEEIEKVVGKISRWTATICGLIVLPLAILQGDVFQLFDEAYRGDTRFVLVLLLVPYLNCSLGIMANALIFSGHSRLSMANNVFVALLNTLLNFLLIKSHGVLGAAIATLVSQGVTMLVYLVEMKIYEGVVLRWKLVYYPHLAFGCTAFVFLFAGLADSGLGRVMQAVSAAVLFLFIAWVAKHPEVRRHRAKEMSA